MHESDFLKQLAIRITTERKKQNITQEQLAFECLIDKTYLARIEGGIANPSLRILYKISRRFNMKLAELLK